MGEVKEAWSRLVKVLSKAARNRRMVGEGRRVSVPRYMPSDYRISSPPLELLLTPTRPDTTPCFRVLLRLSALSDRTTMEEKAVGGDESFRIIPSPLARNKNFPGSRLNFYAFLRTFSLLSSSPSSSHKLSTLVLAGCGKFRPRRVSLFSFFFRQGKKAKVFLTSEEGGLRFPRIESTTSEHEWRSASILKK